MNKWSFILAEVALLAFSSVQGQNLQSALNGLGYSISVGEDVIPGEIFFQKMHSDASIIFQESSQYLIEAVGWYGTAAEPQWLIGGTETGLPKIAQLPVIDGNFGFSFHPNYTGTGFINGIWYSEVFRNSDGVDHILVFPTEIGGVTVPYSYILACEDLEGGGDRDYQDMIVRVDGVEAITPQPPSPSLVNLKKWETSEGGNGHWYAVINMPLLWNQAKTVAASISQEGVAGHLATITCAAENDFIYNEVMYGLDIPSILDECFLGGYWNGSSWQWITGEPFAYTNWSTGEPNPGEPAIAMWGTYITGTDRIPGKWNNEDADIWTFWAIAEWDVAPTTTVAISGTVRSSTGSLLTGVTIGAYSAGGCLLGYDITDAAGSYAIETYDQSGAYAELDVPLGYTPITPVLVPISGTGSCTIDYTLAKYITGSVCHIWWWKMQMDLLHQGKPAEIKTADLTKYGQLIYDHFYTRLDGYGIDIPNVTCADDAVIRPLTADDMYNYYFAPYDASYPARAKRTLLAVLLNVASGRLHQKATISKDGATASQAITYCASLIKTGDVDKCYKAYQVLSLIHQSMLVSSGVIPLSTPLVLYKDGDLEVLPTEYSLSQNYPNPFNPSTDIEFAVPTAAQVRLDVLNILGQTVVTLLDEWMNPGMQRVSWDASAYASGVYFYRLSAAGQTMTKKMILMK